jgi:HD-GYP domain-containing protein (c-di-GMP phosphodiesterase class II)
LAVLLISPPGATPDQVIGHATCASDYIQRPINLMEFEKRLGAVMRNIPIQKPQDAAIPAATKPARPLPIGKQTKVQQDLLPTSSTKHSVSLPTFSELDIDYLLSAAMPGDMGRDYLKQEEVGKETVILYDEALAYVLSSIRRAEAGVAIDAAAGMALGVQIPDSLRRDHGLLLLATDRTAEFSLSQHSVNAAIIAARIALFADLGEDSIVKLCLAAMLHAIGVVRLPRKLLFRKGTFTNEERAEVRRRAAYSAEILAGLPGYEWLPEMIRHVRVQYDEKGFPKAVREEDLPIEVSILSLANVFEACIHRRPYRRAMTGYQALEILMKEVGVFPTRITKALIKSFSIYFFNEFVLLNTGEFGVVIDINPENVLRPLVNILFSAAGDRLTKPKTINLVENPSLYIARAVTTDELPRPLV